ncbi:MAG: hypothetical protein H0V01_06745 [Bacteroidetes bacterium]|nr:hypothetical protein [Bacteroidota bacterium]HET6244419.1 hypothetical protein [Bacteroidia bacterium]
MRIIFTIFVLVFSIVSAKAAGVIVLEGNYQGKNLYIQNPFAGSSVGFCVFEVRINDRVTADETNSSAFEIDFSSFQLELGAAVVVKIMHKDDCKPKVLNPEVLKPKSTFEVVNIKIEKEDIVQWSTKGETGKLPFVIEQYRWNKWINVGEVEGKGTPGANEYSFKVAPHSGENQFRVKQVDYTGKPRYSPTTKFRSMSAEVSFSPLKVSKEIVFTTETMFEIYDNYGNIVKKGFALNVDVGNLTKGIYYINFDSKMDQFMKK